MIIRKTLFCLSLLVFGTSATEGLARGVFTESSRSATEGLSQEATSLPAPNESAKSDTTNAAAAPTQATEHPDRGLGLYFHLGGGIGLALMSSDTITDLFGDQFAIGLGFHASWSLTVGYRNLFQAEMRRGDSSHTLRNNNIVTDETTEVPMDYDYTEYVGKVNLLLPSSGNWADGRTALFLLAGTADVEYLDEVKDGFKGSATVIGAEYMRISPDHRVAVTIGLRRYEIDFHEITLFGETVPVGVKASNYILHTAVTVGLGL